MKQKGGDASVLAREIVGSTKESNLSTLKTCNALKSMVYFQYLESTKYLHVSH